jgi:hypothetical protein
MHQKMRVAQPTHDPGAATFHTDAGMAKRLAQARQRAWLVIQDDAHVLHGRALVMPPAAGALSSCHSGTVA